MPSIWNRALAALAWRRVVASLAISVVVTLATLWVFGSLGGPQTFAVIQANSEYLRYRVFNSQLASFSADGFRVGLADEASLEGLCLSGMLEPRLDETVEYIRQAEGALIIALQRGGVTATGLSFNGPTSLVADPDCAGTPPALLPVWGPGQVGDTFTVRSDGFGPILLSGSLEVFGRTIHLGWFGRGGAVYSASSQPMTIPPGGWIWTDGDKAAPGADVPPEEAALFGYVDAKVDQGLSIRVTTESPLLQIIAPGGRLEPGRIEVGLFAQALNDPNILRAQFALLIFLLLFPIMIDLVALATSKERTDAE